MAAPSSSAHFRNLGHGLGYGAKAPDGWSPLTCLPLHILVGLTGVGKTTTLQALTRTGLAFRMLPNRRVLTDALIISHLQQAEGQDPTPVVDRIQRFAYTRRYREQFAGGMAHALSVLVVAPVQDRSSLFFDGLRGVNEITYAATAFPKATFVLLSAPAVVRIERLAGRKDQFDQIASAEAVATLTESLHADELGLLSTADRARLQAGVTRGTLDASAIRSALAIVTSERHNYAPEETRQTLFSLCPDRVLEIDTVRLTPEQAAAQIATAIAPAAARLEPPDDHESCHNRRG